MRYTIAESVLTQLSERIATHLGLHFPPARWPDLVRGIGAITRELTFRDDAACLQWLMREPWAPKQTALLARHLTVAETYFFRDSAPLTILQQHLLPALLQARQGTHQRLQLWSAGCATGEEPYSMAMLLHTLVPALHNWQITLLATDINTSSLERAAAGVYGAWSFRNTPQWIQDRYFTKRQDGRYEILPEIKNMVTWASLNLVTDLYSTPLSPSHATDVIFCRNVLMYFTPAQAERVVHRLYQTLAPGGWLFVSPCETSQTLFAQFKTVNFPGAILYQKALQPAPTPAVMPSQALPPVAHRRVVSPSSARPPRSRPVPSPSPSVREETQCSDRPAPEVLEALTLYAQGHYAAAAAKLLAPGQPATAADMALLARVYANWGKLTAAREWVEKAIAADKVTAGFHYLHATILQEQGDLEAAIAALKRVLYLDQHLVLAHVALGNLARRQQRNQEATRHFDNARSLLHAYPPDEVLPEAEGLTAGRLMAMLQATTSGERFA